MTYEEACAYLYSLERRGVRLGLDRIVGALSDHGNPQESFGSVLVGGTNGKGSVCAFTASVLQAAGYKTGLFSSPHLVDFRERMRVNGRMITREEMTDLVTRIRGSVSRWHLSFFEATTLITFLWFRERGVETAAVEVGLGGRLDATRPVRALVTVIVSIGLDHMRILGATKESIAGEKAGIIRNGVATVLGVSAADAVSTLKARASEIGSPVYERRRCLHVSSIEATPGGSRFEIVSRDGRFGPSNALTLEIGLGGHHQVANAALAVLGLEMLPERYKVDEAALVRGFERIRWPGRFEQVLGSPRVLCDVAHNVDGARYLAATLSARMSVPCRLVIGMVDGKDHNGFLSALAGQVGPVHYCAPQVDRAFAAKDLRAIGKGLGLEGTVHETPTNAIDAALAEAASDEPVLVTGSFYTVGEILTHLRVGPLDPLWQADEVGEMESLPR